MKAKSKTPKRRGKPELPDVCPVCKSGDCNGDHLIDVADDSLWREVQDYIKRFDARQAPQASKPESVADFKARIAAMMPRETPEEKRQRRPVVREQRHSGFYPKPQMNDDPTKPTP